MKNSGRRYRSQFRHLWSYAVTSRSSAQLELFNSRLDFTERGSIRCDGGVIRSIRLFHQALDMKEQCGDLTLQSSVHTTAVVLPAKKNMLDHPSV